MIQDFSTLFIKFFMGFVIRGVWETKKKLLEVKGLLSAIFLDLKSDSLDLVEFVLDSITQRVINDHLIHRDLKIALFNSTFLDNIKNRNPKAPEKKNDIPLLGSTYISIAADSNLF